MAVFANIHLHGLSAVAGKAVLLVGRERLLFGYVTMALSAFNPFGLVRRMGKVDVVGLPGINPPGDLQILLDVILHQFALVFGISHGRLMAFLALLHFGDTGVSAIRSKCVTVFTTAVLMGNVAKIHGLQFLGIEEVGKNDPSNDQSKYETCNKDYPAHYTFTGSVHALFFHRLASVIQSFGDSHKEVS
jgi:hypothetical protein